jgi:hypothetical protein
MELEPEQIVLLTIHLSETRLDADRRAVSDLCEALEATLAQEEVGEFDGVEFEANVGTIYLYGSNAEALLAAIEPILRASPLASRIVATKRYGPAEDPNAPEERLHF